MIKYDIIEDMRKTEVPEKIVRLVEGTIEVLQANVYPGDYLSNSIDMMRGIRHGDALLTIIFNVTLNRTIMAAGLGNNIIMKNASQIVAFDDDLAVQVRNIIWWRQ